MERSPAGCRCHIFLDIDCGTQSTKTIALDWESIRIAPDPTDAAICSEDLERSDRLRRAL